MISVVMIAMNEEWAVARVIADVRSAAPDAEIVVVDSSTDRTAEIAQGLGAKVIRQFPPKGYGMAMDCALKSASGDVVVTLDCDNTYPAGQIPKLARFVLEDGFDLVDASRLAKKPKAMPLLNFLANKGFAWLASLLFLKPLTDLHSGMRAYKRTMIHELSYDPRGPALPVELLLKPLARGYKIKFTFIDYHERTGTSTMQPLPSAWWTLKRILRARFC